MAGGDAGSYDARRGFLGFRGLKPRSRLLAQRQIRITRHALLIAGVFAASLLFIAANGYTAPAFAQKTSRPPTPPKPATRAVASDSPRIYLMTMGQGDQVYELFGHDALWVHDPTQAMDTVYNWGVFSFDQPHFVLRFLHGDMEYLMLGEPLDVTIAAYKILNRQVWVQELNLTDTERKALVTFLHWNARPENATYRYDYYRDNCSTRVRDAIDRVTGGQVRAQLKAIKTDETYRSHSLRLMQGNEPMVSGVELLLGRPTDVRLSADETSFLPVELLKHLRTVRLDGGKRPLFKEEFVLNEATRPPEPTRAPRLWIWFAPIGVLLTALVLWLSAHAETIGRRRALAATIAILAAIFGILGSVIAALITLTDHVAAHGNENIFMLNPLWLVIAVLGPMVILRRRARTTAVMLVRVAAAAGCVAVLLHLVGLSRQPNWDAIALVLPVELTIAWVLVDASWAVTGRGSSV
jgi:hypothetical protein